MAGEGWSMRTPSFAEIAGDCTCRRCMLTGMQHEYYECSGGTRVPGVQGLAVRLSRTPAPPACRAARGKGYSVSNDGDHHLDGLLVLMAFTFADVVAQCARMPTAAARFAVSGGGDDSVLRHMAWINVTRTGRQCNDCQPARHFHKQFSRPLGTSGGVRRLR